MEWCRTARMVRIVIGIALLGSFALLSCQSPQAAPTATGPKGPYGELRVGLSNFGGGVLDPSISATTPAKTLGVAMFDQLVGVTLDGQPGPGLAERWDMSPDAKTWTFHIRKGVKFHDGSDLTGADVKFSIERILKPEATSANAGVMRKEIAGVDLRDDYTVVVRLNSANPELVKWFTLLGVTPEGLMVPKKYIEEKGVENFRSKPIGSGPWKFVKYDNNVELQLEAVENHWRTTPAFKTLTIRNIGEESTRLAMLKTGQLDWIELSNAKVSEAKAAGLRVAGVQRGGHAVLLFLPDVKNPRAHPIGDVRVRRALSLAINRQELAATLFSGFASLNLVSGMANNSIYLDPNVIKPDPYDLAEARRLLAEAGHANGFTLKMFASGQAPWGDVLIEALAGYFEKVGVKAQIVVQDYATLRPLMQQASPQVLGGATVMRFTPSPFFQLPTLAHSKNSVWKNHANAEIDSLIEKTVASIDPAERKKLGLQAAIAVNKEYSNVPIVDVAELFAMGKEVGEWKPIEGAALPGLEYERLPHAK